MQGDWANHIQADQLDYCLFSQVTMTSHWCERQHLDARHRPVASRYASR